MDFLIAIFGLAMGVFLGTLFLAGIQEGERDQGYGWGRTFIAQTDGNIGRAVDRCKDHNNEHHDGSAVWLGACVKGVYGDDK